MRELLRDSIRTHSRHWALLCRTDLIYKLFSFLLLTPLAALLAQVSLQLSGQHLLADQDILFFLLGPAGWFCLITVGAVGSGIVALELTALMSIMRTEDSKDLPAVMAVRFATLRSPGVLRLTASFVATSLLFAAPFLACAGITYQTLLTEFDINYYLQNWPPVFVNAVVIGALLAVAMIGTFVWLFTGWFLALPLVVFENLTPKKAIERSRKEIKGRRRTLLGTLAGWLLATTLISAIAGGLVLLACRWVLPSQTESLAVLTVAIGAGLLAVSSVNLIINVFSVTTFASIQYLFFHQFAADRSETGAAGLDLVGASSQGAFPFRLNRLRVIVGGVALMIAVVVAGIYALGDVRLADDVQVIAHRGASAAAPENTLAAIRRAIEDGADWVEIDVQETADGEVVVFHDSDFMKLAGNPLKIWDATASDLSQIDIGSSFDPRFRDERVPTLAQVLSECKGKAGVVIELKYYGHDQDLEKRVAEIVEAQQMVDEISLMSLDLAAVEKMKRLRPKWKVGLLMSVSAGDFSTVNVDFLAVNAATVDHAFVRRAHAINRQVMVWTVNDPITMSSMIGHGVDGLITDKPDVARRVLEQRAAMSVRERLLLEFSDLFGMEPEFASQ